MTTTQTIEPVEPRPGTVESLLEHAELEHGGTTIDIESTTLNHEGNVLEATFSCPECRYSETEVYLLRYVERDSDGQRWARNETPTCSCEKSHENGDFFNEVERAKSSTGTATAVGECNWCEARFKDVYKYQMTR